jgi:hypothetical protein
MIFINADLTAPALLIIFNPSHLLVALQKVLTALALLINTL